MYNLIVTSKCEKHCAYCFAKYNRRPDMTLDFIRRVVESEPSAPVRLLGGEPTLHPQFGDIMDYAATSKRRIDLLSNMTFGDAALRTIIDAARRTPVLMIANATDLDGAMRERWMRNYWALRDAVVMLMPGITLMQGRDYRGYARRLLEDTRPKMFRLSMQMPSRDSYIGDKEYGRQFTDIERMCRERGVMATMDCVVFPCMFDDEPPAGFSTACTHVPLDLFSDGMAAYCFPLMGKVEREIGPGLRESLRADYEERAAERPLPERCQSCGRCPGPPLCHIP